MTRVAGIMNHSINTYHIFQQASADVIMGHLFQQIQVKQTTYGIKGVEERGVLSLNQVLKFMKE